MKLFLKHRYNLISSRLQGMFTEIVLQFRWITSGKELLTGEDILTLRF